MVDLWIGLCGSARFGLYMREGGSLLFLERGGGGWQEGYRRWGD